MFQTLIPVLAPAVAQLIIKPMIAYFVQRAEEKFDGAQRGTEKKDAVLKKIDKYLDINPDIKATLPDEILADLGALVEEQVDVINAKKKKA